MEHSKKVMVCSLLIVIFVLIVSTITWYIQGLIYSGDVCSCFIPVPILIPIIASIGLLVGTFVYYTFSPKFEKKIDRKTILNLFENTEAQIINCLIENNGECSQSKIIKETGLSKVKVFRILEKMKMKKLIEKKSNGKTNSIFLNKELIDIFN